MDLSIAKAIVVKGACNRGKTSLIFEFIKDIINNGGEIILPQNYKTLEIINKSKPSDYCIIIKYKGKNILIMSQGDHIDYIKQQVSVFSNVSIVIDIVIGVSRTRGNVVWWWKDNFSGKLFFFDNNQIVEANKRAEYIKRQLYSLKEIFSKYL